MDASGIWSELTSNLNSLDVNLGNSIFRLVLSVMLGAMVGSERKRKGQIAGIRTFALISMGACLAMILSIYVPQEYLGLKNGDPGRIAAQVITGIGFIGGGAMIQQKGSVRGLTTAAGIWMTAIVGMAVGVGMYVCAIIATCLCLVILVTFDWYEHKRRFGQESRVINLRVNTILNSIDAYRDIFENSGIHLSTYYVEYDYRQNITEVNFIILTPLRSNLLPLIEQMRELQPTYSITLSSQTDI